VKTWAIVLLLLLSPVLYASAVRAEIPFDSQPNFLKLPPDLHMGEASGVARQFQGTHLCVQSRQFDRTRVCSDGIADTRVRTRRQVHP